MLPLSTLRWCTSLMCAASVTFALLESSECNRPSPAETPAGPTRRLSSDTDCAIELAASNRSYSLYPM